MSIVTVTKEADQHLSIDFVSDIAGSSLRITNPNATSSCGCGESFSV